MTTIKYLHLLLILLLTQQRANSQYCQIMGLGDCNTNLNEIAKFIPDDYSPILYINLNFHFFVNENDVFDPQNFAETWDGVTVGQQADHNPLDPNNPLQTVTAESIVDAILLRINDRLAGGNPQMDHPVGNNTPHPAYKFRLRKNSVAFHPWTPSGSYPSVTPTGDGIDVVFSNDDTHVLTGPVNFGNGPCGDNYTFDYITGWDFNGDGDNLDPGETGYGQQGIASL